MKRRIVVEPYLRADEARIFDLPGLENFLFVGTKMARDPYILARLIEQDREDLIQEQE